jgi:hypothetical protein
MNRGCETCRHCVADKSAPEGVAGYCRALPPQIIPAGEAYSMTFPQVPKSFYCGLHRFAAFTLRWLTSGDIIRIRA